MFIDRKIRNLINSGVRCNNPNVDDEDNSHNSKKAFNLQLVRLAIGAKALKRRSIR